MRCQWVVINHFMWWWILTMIDIWRSWHRIKLMKDRLRAVQGLLTSHHAISLKIISTIGMTLATRRISTFLTSILHWLACLRVLKRAHLGGTLTTRLGNMGQGRRRARKTRIAISWMEWDEGICHPRYDWWSYWFWLQQDEPLQKGEGETWLENGFN